MLTIVGDISAMSTGSGWISCMWGKVPGWLFRCCRHHALPWLIADVDGGIKVRGLRRPVTSCL